VASLVWFDIDGSNKKYSSKASFEVKNDMNGES